jgi:hypothetical protein
MELNISMYIYKNNIIFEIFDQSGTIMRLSFDNLYAVISPEIFGVNVHMKGSNRFEEFGLLLAFANKNIRL